MMQTFLVLLVDRETGKDQHILVRSTCSDGMQEFVNDLTDLKIEHPVVVDIRQLSNKRPLPRTTLMSYMS